MSHEHLDPHTILETLGLLDVAAVAPVQGGTDTAIWRVEKAGTVYVLRVFQKGEDDDCQREQVVMQAALAAGLPVPQVHAMGKWHDYPALLLSWLPTWNSNLLLGFPATALGVTFGTIDTIFSVSAILIILGGLYALINLRPIRLDEKPSSPQEEIAIAE